MLCLALLVLLLMWVCSFAEIEVVGGEIPGVPTRSLGGNCFEMTLPKVQILVQHMNHLISSVEGFSGTRVREYFVNRILRSDDERLCTSKSGAAFSFENAGVVIGPNLQLLL